MKATNRGFTIVELLIVIVVIAILASVTITAFGGIRQRADYSRLATVIGTYSKAMKLYKADNGTYPQSPTVTNNCLGVEGDLPVTSRYTNNKCAYHSSNNLRNDTLNTALAPYMKNPPRADFNEELLGDDGTYYRGILFTSYANEFYYEYYIKPGSSCPIGRQGWTETNVRLCYDTVR